MVAMTLPWKLVSEVIAPGPDKKGEQPAKIRLYSIASSAVGDNETSQTVSLCALCCKLMWRLWDEGYWDGW